MASYFHRNNQIHPTPITKEARVMRIPGFVYSQNVSRTLRRAAN
jgi:hypothetical protein